MGYPATIWLAEIRHHTGAVTRKACRSRAGAWAWANSVMADLKHGAKPDAVHVREVDFLDR